MKNLNLVAIGNALEAFGLTITGCGIADLSRSWLMTGVLVSGLGRALSAYGNKIKTP